MNPKYDIYEQIDLYLSNQLSGEELAQFNEKLATDVDLQGNAGGTENRQSAYR